MSVEPYYQPAAQGWICPKCGAVMAPMCPMCMYCGPQKTETVTATDTGDKFTVPITATPMQKNPEVKP